MKEMPTLSLASSEKFLKHAFDLQQNKCLKQPIFNLTPKCEKKKKLIPWLKLGYQTKTNKS